MATLLVSEFVKQHKNVLQTNTVNGHSDKGVTPFLKMPFARRKKLVSATIETIMRGK